MKIQQSKINELKPFVNDPKKQTEKQLSMLKKSLRDLRWANPIQITSDHMVAALHARLQSALVLDLFGGSGRTLMELHQLNRVCYGIELDPVYCDVTVQRYVNLTGDFKTKRNGEVHTWV
ncbi:DNA methyltransferase [uncultured Methanolobus sp.]|uniref:DNA methyltransferase n=1 Tax=uncultured Methanolobus sp. TaxID=218300 RepID=UPI0029C91405|nr:DNA methyltransferase [uncultured Methanolobus sp.]